MVNLRTENTTVREFLAEFLGTVVLVALGCSGNAVVALSKAGSTGLIVVPIAWGLALTVAIYVCGGVSGGHVNPAVTLGLACVGKFPWKKILHYMCAQYLGAFIGSVLVYIVYFDGMNEFHNNQTIGIFATYSKEHVRTGTAMMDQIICTAFFLLIICAITDEQNMSIPKGLVPLAIGFTNIGLLHISFGYNCGTPLNPARDLSPRIFTAIAGWGGESFSYKNYSYFWIPIVACHIGGIVGCWIYKLLVENHWPRSEQIDLVLRQGGNGEVPQCTAYRKDLPA